MILRKPYAFLIKNFKKIHAVMALILLYLVYKSSNLMSFLNEYVTDQPSYVGTEITDTLFNTWMFLLPVLIILASIVVIVLMVNKQKPYRFYFINIVSSIFVIVYYAYALNVIGDLELRLVDIRIMRAVRDLIVVVYASQLISTIVTFARATGFNIKQFDFGKDLKEMEIKESDREEFEVELNVDTDKAKRKARRTFRFSRYYYLENRLIINGVVAITFVIVCFSLFMNSFVYNKTYSSSEYFNTRDFIMRIEDAYVTTKDSKNNIITDENHSLVVLRVKIKKRYQNSDDIELDVAKTALKLGDTRYYPIMTYRDKLTDIGTSYEYQIITDEYEYYLLTYQVETVKLDSKTKEFNYVENMVFTKRGINPNIIHIALNFKNLDSDIEAKNYNLEEEVSFDESILKESKLTVSSVEINNTFKNTYQYCSTSNTCYDMVEYLKPSVNSNYDKTLIKFSYQLIKDETLTTNTINNLYNLLNAYATIEYKIDGVVKRQTSGFGQVVPTKTKEDNVAYIEVVDEVAKANEINLILKVRNSEYIIKLK